MTNKVHIIGVAGKTTSALAKMFIDLGWQVSGSDQGAYPPASTYLESIGVKLMTPYDPSHITSDLDLVVVGGNALIINAQNPEYLRAQELGLKVVSYAEVLQEFVAKENSIVVVGNFGKGTIAGAIVKTLRDLGENPSYMVGGEMVDLEQSLVTTDSAWSVLEGDEYPIPPLDGKEVISKFFYYKPKYVILTSAEWDHFDQFPTEEEYVQNYIRLVEQLPKDGLLVANLDGRNIDQVIAHSSARVVTYEYSCRGQSKAKTTPSGLYCATDLNFQSRLFGQFNFRHLTAAYALLTELGFDREQVRQSLAQYRGLKQRLEIVYDQDETVVIRDLAHSPVKAQGAIEAVHERWPDHHLMAVFDIVASSLKNKAVLPELSGRFNQADLVLIPKVSLRAGSDRESLVTGKEIVQAIAQSQPNVEYVPKPEVLLRRILEAPAPKVILLMSSGGMNGLSEKLLGELVNSRC